MFQLSFLIAGFTDALTALRWPLTAAYLGLLVLIGAYGLHRYWLVDQSSLPAGEIAA